MQISKFFSEKISGFKSRYLFYKLEYMKRGHDSLTRIEGIVLRGLYKK